MKLSEIIDFNPKRALAKGEEAPFIEMADLPEGERDVSKVSVRVYSGGGSRFQNGDILFARITPCLENGKTAKVLELPPGRIGHGSTEFIVMAAKDADDDDFIYYLARLPEFRAFAKGHMEGTSGRQRVSWQSLANYEIRDISKSERVQIGRTLAAFDNRINVNRRVSRTIELLIRAMFNHWFVDFGPTRDIVAGQPPAGIAAESENLFPGSFDSEGFPKGWHLKALGDVTSYLNRGISPKYIESGGVLVLNQKCVRNNLVDPTKGRRHDDQAKSISGRELVQGDILVNSTGVGTLGRVAQILDLAEPTIVDSHMTVVRALENQVSWNYLGLTLIGRQQEIENLGEGSTGQTELSRAKLAELKILVPPKPVIDAFDDITNPLRARLAANMRENRMLALMRDQLLPRLILDGLAFS